MGSRRRGPCTQLCALSSDGGSHAPIPFSSQLIGTPVAAAHAMITRRRGLCAPRSALLTDLTLRPVAAASAGRSSRASSRAIRSRY